MYKLVGKKWETLRDGFAWGCIAPIYETNPALLSIRTHREEVSNLFDFFKERFTEITFEEIKSGDVIVLLLPFGLWHVMVYIEDGKFLHCTEATDMEVIKLDDYYLHRIKGVFRGHQ